MRLKNKYFTLLVLIFPVWLFGQQAILEKDELGFADFLKIVKTNHPVAKQADWLIQTANANQFAAKGGFDPKVYYDFQNKYFDSKNYYQLSNGGFQIPTWYGIDFKVGYEKNFGKNVDPQNITSNSGLVYTQVSLPILQGLLIDERRATLKKASLFQQLSVFEKNTVINDLLYNAGKSYWDWQLAYVNLQVFQNALTIAQQRFEAIKRTVILGDRPAIDTIESSIQLQERMISLQQATWEYQSKTLWLSNYLWLDNNTPIEVTDNIIPETNTSNFIENEEMNLLNIINIDSIIVNHPELQGYQIKLKQYEIDRQLKKDKLKPKFNIHYNPLSDAGNNQWFSLNNYKWGLSVGFPLFLRKERGELKLANIKIDNTISEATNKKNSLVNKVKAKQAELQTLKNQLVIYQQTVANYQQLWLSEKKLFEIGESSLFMINNREMSFVNAQIKLNEMFTKKNIVALELVYNFGQLTSVNF